MRRLWLVEPNLSPRLSCSLTSLRDCGRTFVRFLDASQSLLCAASGGQIRRVEALGLHLLFGDGADGVFIPVSTGDDVLVSLVDVRNTRYAEA